METSPRPSHAAYDRLSRLGARAVGARAGAVTLVAGGAHEVAGVHGLPADSEPSDLCRRIVARGREIAHGAYLGVPVLDADGSAIGTVCVHDADRTWDADDAALLEDVAALVLAEIELHRSVEVARHEREVVTAVLDAATDCLVRLDAEGRIVAWGAGAERTFGFTEAEALGHSLARLLSPARKLEAYLDGLAEIMRGEGAGGRIEVVAVHRDGREMPVELTLVDAGDGEHVAGVRDLSELRAAEEQAESAQRRFRALVENVPAVTYSCDYDEGGFVHYMSPQIEEMTGYPAEHFLGDPATILGLVHPDDRERVGREIEETYAGRKPFESEYRIVAEDGTVRHVWDRESIVLDGRGKPAYGQGVMVDLTAMREAQEALQATQLQLESVIGTAPMILSVIDPDGTITFAAGRGLESADVRPDQLVGHSAFDFAFGEAAQAAVRRALAGETASATVGEEGLAFDVTWQPVLSPDGEVQSVVAVGLDVTARRTSEAHLRFLAHHDVLTGAPNRTSLEAEIRRRAAADEELAVLVVDVDGFKTVNDSLGHAAGDDVLRELTRRLSHVADGCGAFLARPGADEFALLLGDGECSSLRDEVEALADAALAVVREPIQVAGSEFVVSATCGAAVGAADAAELLRHADVALGQATRLGNPLGWYAGERGDARGRLTLTARIRNALANGEFSLHYQPVKDVFADRMPAVEALIRWNDPRRGTVPPDEFIPAAEASGVIDDIGRWVVEEVCRQSRAWADEGLELAVGFNVAPRELRREDFAENLGRTARRHGVDPSTLVVEITERAAMREPERTDKVLREIKDLGVRVAIDDFGADHSSLARLRALNVDILKIDRGFLVGVPEERPAASIVTAILSLARGLGMQAVAEGVETAEQLAFLGANGCPRAQGYHIARPMPAEQITACLRAQAAAATPLLRDAA